LENRISGLEDKEDAMEKNGWMHRKKEWRDMKDICKNSATPLKYHTYESWALKKEKSCKPKA
jgi:hypothetical protein